MALSLLDEIFSLYAQQKYDITADTVRYYERIGMIPAVHCTASGQRNFCFLAAQSSAAARLFRMCNQWLQNFKPLVIALQPVFW